MKIRRTITHLTAEGYAHTELADVDVYDGFDRPRAHSTFMGGHLELVDERRLPSGDVTLVSLLNGRWFVYDTIQTLEKGIRP